jgi:uncharacterized protein YdeI (YjbR/CyaY-like superfamily)
VYVAFFRTAAELRDWLLTHHDQEAELWLRLRRSGAGGQGVTYPEALDQALCFGWIDGVRQPVDARSYLVRFSPRTRSSIWSKVNLAHYRRLTRLGLVAEAGRRAFAGRNPARSGLYSFENRPRVLPPAMRKRFQASPAAWGFFSGLAPSYRRTAIFWVTSARKPATRDRRLQRLIEASGRRRRLF